MGWLDDLLPIRRVYANGVEQNFARDVDFSTGFSVALVNGKLSIVASGFVPPTGSGFRHITAGVEDAAASKGTAGQVPVTNAGATDAVWVSVSGDATLSGAGALTVVALSTASATIPVATAALAFGTNPALSGSVRLPKSTGIYFRNSSNTSDSLGIGMDGGDNLSIGAATGIGALILQANGIQLYTSGAGYFDAASVDMRGASHSASWFSADGTNVKHGLPLIGSGTAWGSVDAVGAQAMADANQTPAAAVYQCRGIKTTGALTANRDLTLPTATDAQGYAKWINNTCTGAFSVNVKCAAGTAVLVANGKSAWMWIDSRGVTRMTADV